VIRGLLPARRFVRHGGAERLILIARRKASDGQLNQSSLQRFSFFFEAGGSGDRCFKLLLPESKLVLKIVKGGVAVLQLAFEALTFGRRPVQHLFLVFQRLTEIYDFPFQFQKPFRRIRRLLRRLMLCADGRESLSKASIFLLR